MPGKSFSMHYFRHSALCTHMRCRTWWPTACHAYPTGSLTTPTADGSTTSPLTPCSPWPTRRSRPWCWTRRRPARPLLLKFLQFPLRPQKKPWSRHHAGRFDHLPDPVPRRQVPCRRRQGLRNLPPCWPPPPCQRSLQFLRNLARRKATQRWPLMLRVPLQSQNGSYNLHAQFPRCFLQMPLRLQTTTRPN